MREIEFRGWDKDTERWYYGSYVRLERTTPYPMSQTPEEDAKRFEDEQVDHYIFFTEDNDWGLETRKLRATVDPKSVGQYIGIRDRESIKIYQGDIIKFDGFNREGLQRVAVVDYYNGAYLAKCNIGSRFQENYGGGNFPRGEVIGNIYERPELLIP